METEENHEISKILVKQMFNSSLHDSWKELFLARC